ncbi:MULTISPECIES: PAS domain-containing methyl-accepting chemotaxis protein [Rhodopseudomonas]|uniref:Histidine kinase n=1 Tax=Rhodopseudomonas palustris TaxID=1076 RepID=A0A0D7EUD2_RHOPL|nr:MULTISPECIES: PAS domain-containing methyl-accepting chemotaxis protein [Rhodopseudomonas]KIZ44439.1 histidine kinase [Rhodopseudomonas palustris]MDF3813971.1 PAS domain-containing methyl-accepting chemotaxis protein [Rhodopseudomonas sp. BAL398]WOK19932.1 PAS domain-containing methyl-accepting chemotaxis protein [Rhodopseudomonas sp. BAL398]
MNNIFGIAEGRAALARMASLKRSKAIIELKLDGTIITANDNFLGLLGYELTDIQGKNHRMFVVPELRDSAGYREFWAALNRGEYQSGEFRRITRSGKEIWIQASYNPVLDAAGKPVSVIKFATDITELKIKSLADAGKIAALNRSQAVIEFELDGSIVTANHNFLATMGYTLREIEGKHHSMFVGADAASPAYREFWASLNRGEYQAGTFKRLGKGGKEIWIQASYNPVLDQSGKPFRVVKFATDITAQSLKAADANGQLAAIQKSQAVIEFSLDGIVLTANQKFCDTMGYALSEIQNKHHSMFIEPADRAKPAYAEFWNNLKAGLYQSGEFKRLGKGGREIWIQASYNPILDLDGHPFKVVKFAADVTAEAVGRKKAENARGFIESVAAGSEEMSSSICEIAQTMEKSRQSAGAAVSQVESAELQAKRLTDAASSMGGIVELIGHITGQINLLALNATIESARAGEAGRGFAVVASEVKNLATQAKTATDKINSEIGLLNGISEDVVAALLSIRAAIAGVGEFVNTTAAAVEEQSVVTAEMSANMQRAATELIP